MNGILKVCAECILITFGEDQFNLGNTFPPSFFMLVFKADSNSGKFGGCNLQNRHICNT